MTFNDSNSRAHPVEVVVLLLLYLMVAASRNMFPAISIWEYDEFNYARAVDHFYVPRHAPHPPGTPVYIGVARGFNRVIHNAAESLIRSNVLFGGLLVFPLYFLFRRFSPPRVALGATALSLFNPLLWFYSETALNDIHATFWVITSLAFLFRYESDRYFYLGMIVMAIAIGARPQSALFGILLVPWLLWLKVRRGEFRSAVVGLGLLAVTCLMWFVPLIKSSGGFWNYWHTMQVYSNDTTYGSELGYLVMRHTMSLALFVRAKLSYMGATRPFLRWLLVGLVAWGVLRFLKRRQWGPFLLLTLAFLPWAVMDFLYLDFTFPRYMITTVIAMAFFVVYGLLETGAAIPLITKGLAPAVVLGLVLLSARYTLPLVQTLHTVKSPPHRLNEYIQQHLNPKTDAIIYHKAMYPLLLYYLPNFTLIRESEVDSKRVESIQDKNWYFISKAAPGPGPRHTVSFHVDGERIARLMHQELDVGLSKLDVLYDKNYDWTMTDNQYIRYMTSPDALAYVKSSRQPMILTVTSKWWSPERKPAQTDLRLNEGPAETTTLPWNGWYSQVFPINPTDVGERPLWTLAAKVHAPLSKVPDHEGHKQFMLFPTPIIFREHTQMMMNIESWDFNPAPETQTESINFKPEDRAALGAGWSYTETDQKTNGTFAWSDGGFSTLRLPMQPQGVYELSFQAAPMVRTPSDGPPQAIVVCVNNTVCSPELEMKNDWRWQTFSHWIVSPTGAEGENAEITFHYRFSKSPTRPDGSRDPRALGVAFQYVKLTRLGTRKI